MSFNNTKTPAKPTGKPKYPLPMRPCPKGGGLEFYLEGEMKDKFIELFPKHSNKRIMQWFGISFSTCQRFKRKLGLTKDMRKIRKELARDVKKICEKNGYYDSLRGKAPSPQSIEATRRKRAEGFHPVLQLKKTNPRKYKKLMAKRSEKRKEMLKKEKRRVMYGLEQKTNLRIKLNTLSPAARNQKYLMIKRRNYFADVDHTSWVCYDSETDRSLRMEATAIKHGLKVIEGEEELTDN